MASECAERIAEVLTHESSLTSPENGEKQVADGSVDFDHVSFKYSEKSRKFALADIDLHIPSGATVGIIGGTGSSKTTLIQLISASTSVRTPRRATARPATMSTCACTASFTTPSTRSRPL